MGFGVGYAATGSVDGALGYAEMGRMVGSVAAAFHVACFTGKTPILTSLEGASKLAKDIREGDLLVSRDEFDAAGSLELKRVEEVFTRVSPVVELVVRGRIIETVD